MQARYLNKIKVQGFQCREPYYIASHGLFSDFSEQKLLSSPMNRGKFLQSSTFSRWVSFRRWLKDLANVWSLVFILWIRTTHSSGSVESSRY